MLMFQLLCTVSTILIRNPELTLKELDLDNLVSEANKMFCKASIPRYYYDSLKSNWFSLVYFVSPRRTINWPVLVTFRLSCPPSIQLPPGIWPGPWSITYWPVVNWKRLLSTSGKILRTTTNAKFHDDDRDSYRFFNPP